MIGESRQAPGGGRMSVAQIEHELAKLRTNDDGTLALRSSVLNLIVVTDEDSATEITNSVSKLAGRYPARAVVFIADPDGESNVDVRLSAFCNVRGGGAHVCAEQVTIHAEGPPATHLESLAGPLLIPDLPVFLWYPGEFSPSSPEFAAMAELADRIIVDSAATERGEGCLREISALLEDPEAPAIGDLQWVGLSPWRSLLADTFDAPERAGELQKINRLEVLYAPGGENRALLLIGWLASTLGWKAESAASRDGGARLLGFSGPPGDISVELSPGSPDARLRRIRLYSEEYSFQVSRHRALSDVRTTVMRGEDLLAERTVHLGSFDLGVLVGEELSYRGHDEAYEGALRAAVEVLDL
ncbi:MAG TPA: glucose-6-phosphate dehydrogenase assembly protein OpcA [Rubrobacter sp.]|nr:glucose-6-phosphate dehydrogenase assembly protein OpcA [Rubrobacter sp.]